jgi:hypothetical protein
VFNQVIQVLPTNDYKVYVYFADGKIKLFDASSLVEKGVFRKLKDSGLFIATSGAAPLSRTPGGCERGRKATGANAVICGYASQLPKIGQCILLLWLFFGIAFYFLMVPPDFNLKLLRRRWI